MNEDVKKEVIKALQKNHRNGPINAKNLAGIYENVIEEHQTMAAEKIASMINDLEMKSDSEEPDEDES